MASKIERLKFTDRIVMVLVATDRPWSPVEMARAFGARSSRDFREAMRASPRMERVGLGKYQAVLP